MMVRSPKVVQRYKKILDDLSEGSVYDEVEDRYINLNELDQAERSAESPFTNLRKSSKVERREGSQTKSTNRIDDHTTITNIAKYKNTLNIPISGRLAVTIE